MWYSIIIITILGMPGLIQLDDKRGPYSSVSECYMRGSVMIKEVVSSGKFPPILHTQALCLDTNNIKEPKEESKPKKVEKDA